jgi:energy-coupling factor transport system permease protein
MKLDVRTKLVIAAILSTLALVYQNAVVLSAVLLMTFIALIMLKVSLHVIIDFRKFLFLYLILIVIQSLFIKGGEPLLTIGEFHLLTTESLIYGIAIILRFLILIGSGLILLNCDMSEMLLALDRMRIPYEIVFMIQIGIRFIPVLINELSNIFDTIQLRGVDLRKVYKRKVIRVYISIFTPLLYSIWQKTEQLSILLELRGFRRYPTRTYYRTISMGAIDYTIIGLSLSLAILFVVFASILTSRGII